MEIRLVKNVFFLRYPEPGRKTSATNWPMKLSAEMLEIALTVLE